MAVVDPAMVPMSEYAHQCALFEWAKLAEKEFPELALMFAIPNGGLRNKTVAAKLRASGTKAGVPDIFLPVARGQFHGMFIEMKFGSNDLTESQREWIYSLQARLYFAVVSWDWEHARALIVQYLRAKDE